MDLCHGGGRKPFLNGCADELMQPQRVPGRVDEGVRGQRLPREAVAGQVKGGGELPEDLIVEDPGRAQYLQRPDLFGSPMLQATLKNLILRYQGTVDSATNTLMSVHGPMQVERKPFACVTHHLPAGRPRNP